MYKWNYKKCFSNLITAAAVVVLAWFALSYFEILCKNVTPAPEYSNNNLFIIFMEAFIK